jgi:hypothetical protein
MSQSGQNRCPALCCIPRSSGRWTARAQSNTCDVADSSSIQCLRCGQLELNPTSPLPHSFRRRSHHLNPHCSFGRTPSHQPHTCGRQTKARTAAERQTDTQTHAPPLADRPKIFCTPTAAAQLEIESICRRRMQQEPGADSAQSISIRLTDAQLSSKHPAACVSVYPPRTQLFMLRGSLPQKVSLAWQPRTRDRMRSFVRLREAMAYS